MDTLISFHENIIIKAQCLTPFSLSLVSVWLYDLHFYMLLLVSSFHGANQSRMFSTMSLYHAVWTFTMHIHEKIINPRFFIKLAWLRYFITVLKKNNVCA